MKNLIKNFFRIFFLTFILLLIVDQFFAFFRPNFLYPSHYDISNLHRSPKPYIEFAGLPNALDHNEYGYRYKTNHSKEDFNIAFFGGSTGYDGTPPIATLLEGLLREKFDERKINVANFSVVSSNHRQHIHNIIESNSLFKPDMIIFYGGYNETAQTFFYDPRPGYPYNFFYRAETDSWKKVLLEKSPIANIVNRVGVKYGWFDLTPLSSIQHEVKVLSLEWMNSIHNTYLETLSHGNILAKSFTTNQCSFAGRFKAFYQPYQIPEPLKALDEKIRISIKKISYIHDLSDTYDDFNHVYTDIVHVSQEGNELMARRIFNLLILDKSLVYCIQNKPDF